MNETSAYAVPQIVDKLQNHWIAIITCSFASPLKLRQFHTRTIYIKMTKGMKIESISIPFVYGLMTLNRELFYCILFGQKLHFPSTINIAGIRSGRTINVSIKIPIAIIIPNNFNS